MMMMMMMPGLSLQTGIRYSCGVDQTEIRVANAHGMTLDDDGLSLLGTAIV